MYKGKKFQLLQKLMIRRMSLI